MGKNSRERVTSSTPTLQKEGNGEVEGRPIVKFLPGNSRLNIWPEWDDASLANEKWDVPQKGKGDRAARTPGTLFEDPDGLIQMPASLKVESWRRPSDYLGEKVQTVVEDPEQTGRLKILLNNQAIFKASELVRAIITEIALLCQTEIPSPPGLRSDLNGSADVWKPWHHLYPRSKPPNSFPIHSASGKYAVKLFWMGAWRKVIVDDQIPFDVEGRPLLPMCECETELWLPVLSKAIIKIASLNYGSERRGSEVSGISVIQMLTGWMPEVIDIKSRGDEDMWNLISSILPKWTEESKTESSSAQSVSSNTAAANPATKEPSLIFGTYNIGFNGDEPIGVPEIRSEVGGTSFTGPPPPMVWLTETRRTAIPPPKPAPFTVGEPGAQLKPTEALFQLRQQRQQRIKHELLLKELAATSPKLLHVTSAFPNFEDMLGDYVADVSQCLSKVVSKKTTAETEKKGDGKKKDGAKAKKEEKDKGEKKKEDKKKNADEKSEKAEKKRDKKKTPDALPEAPAPVEDDAVEEAEEEEEALAVSPLLSFWVEMKQFLSSFSSLLVFHKTTSYICHRSVADMRNVSPTSVTGPTGGRRTAAGHSTNSATHLRGIPAPSPLPTSGNISQHNHSLVQGQAGDHQPPIIICIDSTNPIEMLVSFTSLSHWHDSPVILNPILGPVSISDNPLGYTANEAAEYNSNPDNVDLLKVPGKLEIVEYRWSDTVARSTPLLELETSTTKTCRLSLPAGLHTLRLEVAAPYAWHADLLSATPFVIADTESYVNHVNKESLRFQAAALRLVKTIGEAVENFSEPEEVCRTIEEVACADKDRDRDRVFPDITVFFESLFNVLEGTIGDQLTTQHRDAWTSFATTLIRAYRKGRGDSVTGIFEFDPVPFKKRATLDDEVFEASKEGAGESKVEGNGKEHAAANTIQRHFRGHHVRKRTQAVKKGHKQNLSVKGLLQESWGKLEGDILNHGIAILNKVLEARPQLLETFSFKEDREKIVYFADYAGSHGEVPARNWFIMSKEVFTAPEPTLVSLSLTPASTGVACLRLRVIDNDTGAEIPTICRRPKPFLYTPNKYGYTVMCEGKTPDGPLAAGKFRLRLIGSTPQLLLPARDFATATVASNEVKEYHVPEKNNIMFRYTVNVTSDTPTTVQVGTSKPDVNLRLQIFDGEETLVDTEGIGHIALPCVTFYCDDDATPKGGRRTPQQKRETEGKLTKTNSTALMRNATVKDLGRQSGAKSGGTKSPGRTRVAPPIPEPDSGRKKNHHYVIQATVLRDSWAKNTSPWQEVLAILQAREAGDQLSERPMSGSIPEEKPSTPNKKRTLKEEKSDPKKVAKAGGKPPSPAFDESKPFWTLRVCCDSGDEVILRRDTQREDEIRSIKAAWEELQPGRAAKARALREKYLARKAEETADTESVKEEVADKVGKLPEDQEAIPVPATAATAAGGASAVFVESTPRAETPKFYEIPPPFRPYVSGECDDPELFDEEKHEQSREESRSRVEDFHHERRDVLAARTDDRATRNEMKERLINTAETMQIELDTRREDILALRDSLRQKQLAEEAARAAAAEPDHASSPSPKPTSAKKPKSPKGAKKKK